MKNKVWICDRVNLFGKENRFKVSCDDGENSVKVKYVAGHTQAYKIARQWGVPADSVVFQVSGI